MNDLPGVPVPEAKGGALRKRARRHWSLIRTLFVAILACTYLYPFLFMLATAFKPEEQYNRNPAGWPTSLTFDHVRYAWSAANLDRAFINSLVATSTAVVVGVVMSSAAAFWFLRNRGKLARTLLAIFGSIWIVPFVVWLIPFFLLLSNRDLTNNLVVLGIVYGTIFTPGILWLVWAYMLQGIPVEVLDASRVDGASLWQQYWRIVMPLSLPILGTIAALAFIFSWSDLLIAIVLLQDPDQYTLVPSAAFLVSRYDAAIQETTAAALLSLVPSLIVFMIAQKAIIRGVTTGVAR